jgi:hypothetical protein
MKTIICTLFEGHYHFGVAALVNSLYHNGYRGEIYAGYRGDLPSWTSSSQRNESLGWPGSKTLKIAQDLELHFIPLTTDYHLTNYKPDFMLDLLKNVSTEVDGIFFFDPDIVITEAWALFEQWITCGVALCEDVNSPIASHHPRRIAWRRYFGANGLTLNFKDSIYVNGGFVGVSKKDLNFLEVWKLIQELMAVQIGGLNKAAIPFELSGERLSKTAQSPFSPFGRTDQDALNAAIEAWSGDISFVGKEGMAFKAGVPFMPHALGRPKPWQWKPMSQAIKGRPPRRVDIEYWNSASGPIKAHAETLVKKRKVFLKVAKAVGRVYSKR